MDVLQNFFEEMQALAGLKGEVDDLDSRVDDLEEDSTDPPDPPLPKLNAPRNLSISDITSTGATATWTAPSGTAPDKYRFTYSPGSGVTGGYVTKLSTSLAGALQAQTTYTFTVKAQKAGYRDSDVVSVEFTTSAPPKPKLNPPRNLQVSSITSDGATFTWDAPTGTAPDEYEWMIADHVNSPITGTTTSTSLTRDHLNTKTRFLFSLSASKEGYRGSSAADVYFTTL